VVLVRDRLAGAPHERLQQRQQPPHAVTLGHAEAWRQHRRDERCCARRACAAAAWRTTNASSSGSASGGCRAAVLQQQLATAASTRSTSQNIGRQLLAVVTDQHRVALVAVTAAAVIAAAGCCRRCRCCLDSSFKCLLDGAPVETAIIKGGRTNQPQQVADVSEATCVARARVCVYVRECQVPMS
jgi:hypothetical protein